MSGPKKRRAGIDIDGMDLIIIIFILVGGIVAVFGTSTDNVSDGLRPKQLQVIGIGKVMEILDGGDSYSMRVEMIEGVDRNKSHLVECSDQASKQVDKLVVVCRTSINTYTCQPLPTSE